MDFRERTPFGRTGLMASRIGVAAGYGVPAAAVERSFHEYGVNLLWISPLRRGGMVRAIRNLAPRHRDELRIALALPAFAGFLLQSYVERSLKKLGIERADLMVLQALGGPPGQELVDRLLFFVERKVHGSGNLLEGSAIGYLGLSPGLHR